MPFMKPESPMSCSQSRYRILSYANISVLLEDAGIMFFPICCTSWCRTAEDNSLLRGTALKIKISLY